ncbi:methionine ABC transporter substrate-binding protein [Erysipelotrichaceae bacterium OH741_COT-311]|nr:methionine ABC transporter substrate-binding protein [Erysipelotrichaceae bacterium OH741_COT-311]
MKKILISLLAIGLFLTGCSSKNAKKEESKQEVIKISATLEPHATILEEADKILQEKYNIKLDIIILDDYYIFNKSLSENEVDANFFQHVPFFENEVVTNGYDIVNAGGIHIEPFGLYSKSIKSIDEVKENDRIVISNSVADYGRILSILKEAGLITLKDGFNPTNATLDDIAENPKNLKFVEIKPELLVTALNGNEGVLVAINGNYAITGGLNPVKDALVLEQADQNNPYVNIVAVKKGRENEDKLVKLIEVLKSEEIKQFILNKFSDGSVIPAQ